MQKFVLLLVACLLGVFIASLPQIQHVHADGYSTVAQLTNAPTIANAVAAPLLLVPPLAPWAPVLVVLGNLLSVLGGFFLHQHTTKKHPPSK